MVAASKNLKDVICKYNIGDTFSNGDGFFIVSKVSTRDEYKKLLKEPLYTLDRFPEQIIKDDKIMLKLRPFEAYESEIVRQCTFNWKKTE